LARAPRREVSLHAAADLAMEMGRLPAARDYWRRALEVNPYRYGFHYGLAAQLAQTGEWAAAAQACQQALQLNAANFEIRQLLIRCYVELRERGRARAEFERLRAMNPPAAERLRRWFGEDAEAGQSR
jgi:tetratricopeptide (TPR) repeat protein